MDTEQQTAVIIGLNLDNEQFEYSMTELAALAEANNLEVVARLVQKLDHPDKATYFGKGKVEELKMTVLDKDADMVIVNDELSPSQIRNLEKQTETKIIDRTGLILEIFANRARTHEAKLQVQLAKLQYQLPRLHTSASQRLDQQTGSGGGGFTNRGSGESQLELNRRVIEKDISHIKQELKDIQKSDLTQRKQRDGKNIPTVALVGYTNAGKSTIMNQLVNRYGENQEKQVMVKNMLFATLDTSVRKLIFDDNKTMLLSDTVGFVSKLPHQLVKAFRSTLAEAANADLLVQVVDEADENKELMMKTTEQTLKEIGVENIPMITVFNKADILDEPRPQRAGDNLIMAALEEDSIDELIQIIRENSYKDYVTEEFLIPFDKGDIVNYLNTKANVLSTEYVAEGTKIKAELTAVDSERFKQYLINN
ncbi:GTP-binding protein HflX [Apilactobacillus kunkeei DSM 12361 = ATCC 700308]|uniref:GTPase HflX n=1 Tax=Apilactobacillus kunkeei DSM 12361 = ATCC 700308 TaxID=1423768 RepID=A0A0R1FVB2_9LACO|nr:GTPase HflX [Apilactobacillus kunkeei]KOY72691.1 GTPase HflX [Apilactobacillus kunkeei DSM 12361 = ATCC 700308]KRK22439.1 GTP-binding protein HflX [Apilactobacillus kunkeei DSM 12361 = ATCC 700308]MCK8620109.1 GTPase HflX [Apilactobacillus kunkeei]MCK8625345.1 GTPase HflX [Apilactobacillus kunkeei]QYU52768.1 GTPase HflX [Apilactobacillus kunkeei]